MAQVEKSRLVEREHNDFFNENTEALGSQRGPETDAKSIKNSIRNRYIFCILPRVNLEHFGVGKGAPNR